MRPAALWLLLASAVTASAQTSVKPLPTGPRGAYLTQLTMQTQALLSAPASLPQAFQVSFIPMPEARTPAGFAARFALVEALSAPGGLKELTEAVREHEGPKGVEAVRALEGLGRAIAEASGAERRGLGDEARVLLKRFDGGTAAPGESVDLSLIPTEEDGPGKDKARRLMKEHRKIIRDEQEKMASSKTRGVYFGLQGSDASGKGGAQKRPLFLYPAWTHAAAFKKPTDAEAARPYLERIEREIAGLGKATIHDRTHYEDILMPTILKTRPPEEIAGRFGQNLSLERRMREAGMEVVKIFFHISYDEQERRFISRAETPRKKSKVSEWDWIMHNEHWEDQMRVYGEILARTSPPWALWYIVGADDEPRRDLAVARLGAKILRRMGLEW